MLTINSKRNLLVLGMFILLIIPTVSANELGLGSHIQDSKFNSWDEYIEVEGNDIYSRNMAQIAIVGEPNSTIETEFILSQYLGDSTISNLEYNLCLGHVGKILSQDITCDDNIHLKLEQNNRYPTRAEYSFKANISIEEKKHYKELTFFVKYKLSNFIMQDDIYNTLHDTVQCSGVRGANCPYPGMINKYILLPEHVFVLKYPPETRVRRDSDGRERLEIDDFTSQLDNTADYNDLFLSYISLSDKWKFERRSFWINFWSGIFVALIIGLLTNYLIASYFYRKEDKS